MEMCSWRGGGKKPGTKSASYKITVGCRLHKTFMQPAKLCKALPADCLQNVITEKWLYNAVQSPAGIKRLCSGNAGEICKGYGNHADSGEAMCELDSPINRTRIAEMSHQKSNIAKMTFTLTFLPLPWWVWQLECPTTQPGTHTGWIM